MRRICICAALCLIFSGTAAAEQTRFFLNAYKSSFPDDRICDIQMFLYNGLLAETIDRLHVTATLHGQDGRKIATARFHFSYADPQQTVSSNTFVSQKSCIDFDKVRVREVTSCAVGGKSYSGCKDHMPAVVAIKSLED